MFSDINVYPQNRDQKDSLISLMLKQTVFNIPIVKKKMLFYSYGISSLHLLKLNDEKEQNITVANYGNKAQQKRSMKMWMLKAKLTWFDGLNLEKYFYIGFLDDRAGLHS